MGLQLATDLYGVIWIEAGSAQGGCLWVPGAGWRSLGPQGGHRGCAHCIHSLSQGFSPSDHSSGPLPVPSLSFQPQICRGNQRKEGVGCKQERPRSSGVWTEAPPPSPLWAGQRGKGRMGLQGKLTARDACSSDCPRPLQLFSFLDTFCKPAVPLGLLATGWLTLQKPTG